MNPSQSVNATPEIVTLVVGLPRQNSYDDIVRSSSIIGGAQGIRLLVLMLQTKLVAVLLGPSGVGLIGLFQSVTGLMGTLSGLGLASSAVREVAEAHSSGNPERMARTIKVMRRACWVTGLLGWLLTVVMAWPLSVWTFGTPERALPIALLGFTLLLTSISAAQVALVQGFRRIGDLARLQVLPAISGTVICTGLYAWLGEQGIVPVLIIMGVVNLGFSWFFARRVSLVTVDITWHDSLRESGRLITLGMAFMWSGVLTTGVGLVTRAWIVRDFGPEANGMYQAAWGISGVFAGFILQAMGTDFYPRLTAVAKDDAEVNRLVNEQTEVGILLAVPGLLATLVFAPWVIRILYSVKFLEAGYLLPCFVLGIFGSVVSWPLGFIQLAKGASRTFALTETLKGALLLLLTWLGLRWWQVPGVAMAFAILNGTYFLGMCWVARRLSGFRWASSVRWLLFRSTIAVGMAFGIANLLPPMAAAIGGGFLVMAAAYLCLLRLIACLGTGHRISRAIFRLGIIRKTTSATS